MTNQKIDLRVIKSKEAIYNAFIDLLEEKGFDTITVKDVTTRARINRGTFYTYYLDKYDLMEKCELDFIKGLSDLGTSNVSTEDVTPQLLICIFEYIKENKRLANLLLNGSGTISFQNKLKQFMEKRLFTHDILNPEKFLVPTDMLNAYISAANVGLIQQWLKSNLEKSPEEMAEILRIIIVNGPLYAAGITK